MPRFVNLKGSMNPFDNNKPVLSSSDRIRNKKSKYIYAAAKQKFQTKRRCNGKNIKYYKKGTVRSVTNYKLQQDLAIGNALCEDCNGRGNLCGTINKSNLVRIDMANNNLSAFYGTGAVLIDIFSPKPFSQKISSPVIQSDVSGVWGPASPPEVSKSDLSGGTVLPNSFPLLKMPYGYINNLIKIPRNLNGAGITIDPSNILFQDSNCGQLNLQRNNNIKTTIVIRGSINFDGTSIVPEYPLNCTDSSYNKLINTFITLWVPRLTDDLSVPLPNLTYGIIKKICCVGEKTIKTDSPPFIFRCAIVDIFVDIFSLHHISNMDDLNLMVNTKPLSLPNGFYHWPQLPSLSPFDLFYILSLSNNVVLSSCESIESVRIFQGTCDFNQTTGNKTKESYMSCLGDGTKKINFTT